MRAPSDPTSLLASVTPQQGLRPALSPHDSAPSVRSVRGLAGNPESGGATESARSARIVVLASGAGTNLAALLAVHENPAFGARVVGVVSDKAGAGALGLARSARVPTAVVVPADFPDRDAWNAGMLEAVRVFHPDYVVLAGFMRILAPGFVGQFPGRMLNTHPALLPSFPGAHAVRDALAYGVRVTGCTVHIVDDGVDTGPILAQVAVPVAEDDDESRLHERIKVAERALLVEAVGRVAREGLHMEGHRAVFGAEPLVAAQDYTT